MGATATIVIIVDLRVKVFYQHSASAHRFSGSKSVTSTFVLSIRVMDDNPDLYASFCSSFARAFTRQSEGIGFRTHEGLSFKPQV